MEGIILKDESYLLMGILFQVHRELGSICKEINYCDAIEMIFKKRGILYEREKEVSIPFDGESLKGFRADFVIFGRIILEVKATFFIKQEFIRQTLRYLKATDLSLGIVANFKRQSLEYKRIINKESGYLKNS
jgi:GxxExxY protein